MRTTGMLLLCALSLLSCRTEPAKLRPVRAQAGAVFVYLQPSAPSAERIRFRIDAAGARRSDGRTIPLDLYLNDVDAAASSRERLLAAGPLLTGSYLGLVLGVDQATLRGEQGDTALVVPQREARIELPFEVRAGRSIVVTARFHDRGAVDSGYRFTPSFSAEPAPPPTTGLVGVVPGCDSGALTIFDKLTGRVSAVVQSGRSAGGSAIDTRDLRAYVALPDDDRIEVVDLQQSRSVEHVRLAGGDRPVELALSPVEGLLLAVNPGSDTLSLITLLSPLAERDRVPVGDEPASLVVGGNGRRAYVLNVESSTISVVDLTAATVVGTIAVDADPIRAALDRRSERLYVIHGFSPYLTIVDTVSLGIVDRVYIGSGATALAVDSRSDRVYVALGGTNQVEIYDPASLLPVDSVPVDGDVVHMTIDDEGNNLVLALEQPNEVRMVRLVGHDTVARVDLAERPCWVSLLGER